MIETTAFHCLRDGKFGENKKVKNKMKSEGERRLIKWLFRSRDDK